MPLSPVTEDPDVHDPDPSMPLSPIVVRLKRHRSSLFEDPSHDQNLTPVTEDSDVAKRPRSSLPSEHPDIQGGKHPDPAKPLKPVSRTLKEIMDEAGPLISKELQLEYAKIFAKSKEAEPITNRVTGSGGPINVVESYEAKPITNRVMASFPEPLLGGRINVVQSYGPDTLAEAAAAGASKRTLRDTPLFGGCINVVQSYGPDTVAETEAARASKKTLPDTPFWNTIDSLRRRSAENPKYCGKEAWKEFIERQRSTWGPCQICLKADDHMSLHCPYLDYVPEGASVGPGVELVCRGCGLKDKHPGMNWSKRAILKSCFICASDHWGTDCPHAKQHKTVPYNPFPFSDR
ncbi:uncharacterized protein LOC133733017 [Rosa rugosa]|uniref:uncharacterized protein LOC133733017 n=1 Tax=Rosa rugosa TaxID=74645 RepID=UPI002B4174FE|nr:uncharacterized protein LOC133733017 [Rosa rugosa]